MREQITEYQHWTSRSAEVSEHFVTHFYQCINVTRNHLTLCTCNEYFFVHRRQKGIIGNIKLHWHETQLPTSILEPLLTNDEFYRKAILEKNYFCSISQWAISFRKKKLHEKQTHLSAHTSGGRKKRLVAYVLLFFKKGARQESLKDHVNFLLLGGWGSTCLFAHKWKIKLECS